MIIVYEVPGGDQGYGEQADTERGKELQALRAWLLSRGLVPPVPRLGEPPLPEPDHLAALNDPDALRQVVAVDSGYLPWLCRDVPGVSEGTVILVDGERFRATSVMTGPDGTIIIETEQA